MTAPREERIARNEAIVREVNERVDEVVGAGDEDLIGFVCECGDESCGQTIELTAGEYESVRADPTLFAVVPGHATGDVEDVVARTERFEVVRKHPEEAAIAQDTDPRSSG